MTFDLGWPWTVLHLDHSIFTSNISNMVRDTMLDTLEVRWETTNALILVNLCECRHKSWLVSWWTVLVQGYYNYTSNISITVYGMQQHWADTHSIERIYCFVLLCAWIWSSRPNVKNMTRVVALCLLHTHQESLATKAQIIEEQQPN